MKKLLILTLLSLSTLGLVWAQETPMTTTSAEAQVKVDEEDYERLLEGYLKVKFREYAYNALDLTEEEIIDLDPIYLEYMGERNDVMDRRLKLMNELENSMTMADADVSATTASNYWDAVADQAALQRTYYNKMEDVISDKQAFQFFLMEDMLEGRVIEEKTVEYVPIMVQVDRPEVVYYRELDRYNRWLGDRMVTIEGTVSLDHEYTYDGLRRLTRTLEAAAMVADADIMHLEKRTDGVMTKAAEMRKDPYDDKHADLAHDAFMMVVSLVEDMQDVDGIMVSDQQLTSLRNAADKINPNELYTEQADHAYQFFAEAQSVVNQIVLQSGLSADEREYMDTSDSK